VRGDFLHGDRNILKYSLLAFQLFSPFFCLLNNIISVSFECYIGLLDPEGPIGYIMERLALIKAQVLLKYVCPFRSISQEKYFLPLYTFPLKYSSLDKQKIPG
jgi:hypothetical protein